MRQSKRASCVKIFKPKHSSRSRALSMLEIASDKNDPFLSTRRDGEFMSERMLYFVIVIVRNRPANHWIDRTATDLFF